MNTFNKGLKSKHYEVADHTIDYLSIPYDFIMPYGKYKDMIYGHIRDIGYKKWFYENIYLKKKLYEKKPKPKKYVKVHQKKAK